MLFGREPRLPPELTPAVDGVLMRIHKSTQTSGRKGFKKLTPSSEEGQRKSVFMTPNTTPAELPLALFILGTESLSNDLLFQGDQENYSHIVRRKYMWW